MSPVQNVGAAYPASEKKVTKLFRKLFGFRALITPSSTPMVTAMESEATSSITVAGMRCMISLLTGSLK